MINWNSELKKCLLDKSRSYMISRYVFRNDLWEKQMQLLRMSEDKKMTVVVKSRCVGYTYLMAALTACEMVLNADNDIKYNIIYRARNKQDAKIFKDLVLDYILRIPRELRLYNGNLKTSWDDVAFGNAHLTTAFDRCSAMGASNGKIGIAYVIYDEPVRTKNDFDVDEEINDIWKPITDKIIVGGVGNHLNAKWFEFVRKHYHLGNVIELPWESNPFHFGDWQTTSFYPLGQFEPALLDEYSCRVFREVKCIEYADDSPGLRKENPPTVDELNYTAFANYLKRLTQTMDEHIKNVHQGDGIVIREDINEVMSNINSAMEFYNKKERL